jgi:hypothetical protein
MLKNGFGRLGSNATVMPCTQCFTVALQPWPDISKKATPEPSFWLIYYKGYGF